MTERIIDETIEEKYCGETKCSACGEVIHFDPEEEDGYDAMVKHKMYCPKWTIYDDDPQPWSQGCEHNENY